MEKFSLFVLNFILSVIVSIYKAWILCLMWSWFKLDELSGINLNTKQLFLISTVSSFFFLKSKEIVKVIRNKEERNYLEDIQNTFNIALIYTVLLCGYLVASLFV